MKMMNTRVSDDMWIRTGKNYAEVPGRYAVCMSVHNDDSAWVCATYDSKWHAIWAHLKAVYIYRRDGNLVKFHDSEEESGRVVCNG